eukprot:6599785-Lingulodinium_polyedra.AAC.1
MHPVWPESVLDPLKQTYDLAVQFFARVAKALACYVSFHAVVARRADIKKEQKGRMRSKSHYRQEGPA